MRNWKEIKNKPLTEGRSQRLSARNVPKRKIYKDSTTSEDNESAEENPSKKRQSIKKEPKYSKSYKISFSSASEESESSDEETGNTRQPIKAQTNTKTKINATVSQAARSAGKDTKKNQVKPLNKSRKERKRSSSNECVKFSTQDSEISVSKSECIPNGAKFIACHICSAEMWKIYELRFHMNSHTNAQDYDLENLKSSTIYQYLNPEGRDIEIGIIRDFIVKEIEEKRYSQFYSILNEANVELHISDSETESDEEQTDAGILARKTYKCSLCPTEIVFNRRYLALEHQQAKHANCKLPYECDKCGEEFISIQLLIRHLKTLCECDEYPVKCLERFRQYLIKVTLAQFDDLAKARRDLKQHRLQTAQKLFTCKICGNTFLRSEHLARHKAVHLPDELKFSCTLCGKKFNRKDILDSHKKVHMEQAARAADCNQDHLCQLCGICFNNKPEYVAHMFTHGTEKPAENDSVPCRDFLHFTELDAPPVIQKPTEISKQSFTCNICSKPFTNETLLAKHMKYHTGPYCCIYCFEAFQRPGDLANHLRSHKESNSS